MTKLKFYSRLVSDWEQRASQANVKATPEDRGNLAYLCEHMSEKQYMAFLEDTETFGINDYCWRVFQEIYKMSEANASERDILFRKTRYAMAKSAWRMKALCGFETVRMNQYPEWFFVLEKMNQAK